MSQRHSGYPRVKNDKYETPTKFVELLEPHIPKRISKIFDPCCGSGNIVRALNNIYHDAWGKDLESGYDYLKDKGWHEAIVTNPPYSLAEEFITHAVGHSTFIAMLLRCDYHHAQSRQYLFADNPWFSKIIALRKRIVFIARKGAAPSFYHSWFIWCAEHHGDPTVTWAT